MKWDTVRLIVALLGLLFACAAFIISLIALIKSF